MLQQGISLRPNAGSRSRAHEVGIKRKHGVPDGKREEIDGHPADIGDLPAGDDNQDTRETQDTCKQDKRLQSGVRFDSQSFLPELTMMGFSLPVTR